MTRLSFAYVIDAIHIDASGEHELHHLVAVEPDSFVKRAVVKWLLHQ